MSHRELAPRRDRFSPRSLLLALHFRLLSQADGFDLLGSRCARHLVTSRLKHVVTFSPPTFALPSLPPYTLVTGQTVSTYSGYFKDEIVWVELVQYKGAAAPVFTHRITPESTRFWPSFLCFRLLVRLVFVFVPATLCALTLPEPLPFASVYPAVNYCNCSVCSLPIRMYRSQAKIARTRICQPPQHPGLVPSCT